MLSLVDYDAAAFSLPLIDDAMMPCRQR